MKIETILTPAELPALAQRDLRATACVVFDVLRATSTFVTALHHGAQAIIPVSEIAEALAFKKAESGKRKAETILLGGERNGVRISADGIDFDLGNSPREYTPEKVRGKTIVSTTTNGTRALRACIGAKLILAASFLNLSATAQFLLSLSNQDRHPQSSPSPPPGGGEGRGEVAHFLKSPLPAPLPVKRGEGNNRVLNVLLVCAGTRENPALEDILAAGALIELLAEISNPLTPALSPLGRGEGVKLSDSAQTAFEKFVEAKSDLAGTIMREAENAKRLLGIPELRDDVAFCLQRDTHPLVAKMEGDGAIRRG